MSDLPQGWEWATLGDLDVDAQPGFASGQHNRHGHGLIHLRPMNISRAGKMEFADIRYVENTNPLKRVQTGDIVFNNTNSPVLVGKTALVATTTPVGYSNHLTRLRPPEVLDSRFIAYQLHHLWLSGYFRSVLSHHVNQASVATSALLRTPIAIGPSAEQKRIVAALDEFFSHLDTGDAYVLQARLKLDSVRRSFLSSVMRDTSDSTWQISDLVEEARTGWSRSRLHRVDPDVGTPYLRMNNISPEGALDLRDVTSVAATDSQRQRFGITRGDVLFNNKNSAELVGKVAVADDRVEGWVFNENITRLRLTSRVEPRFFALQLVSPAYRERLARLRSASTNVAAIYTRDLKTCRFWLPDAPKQREIVENYDRLASGVSASRSMLSTTEERAGALRRALLVEAFAGRLVPQDPDDESASALLGRIRSERAAQPTPRRTRRTVQ